MNWNRKLEIEIEIKGSENEMKIKDYKWNYKIKKQ